MGIERYSRTNAAWERQFDELQRRCHDGWSTPTVGELRAHGIKTAYWQCRSIGWKNDGKGECWHKSASFPLARFGDRLEVLKMRRLFVCSECGRNRPYLQLEAE